MIIRVGRAGLALENAEEFTSFSVHTGLNVVELTAIVEREGCVADDTGSSV
ncbi:hypothetical protein [Amycolatopsis acidicola]|uniref:hypothetical protein n=1 Tax=Amycolatopsis acidicola TaxID=2596893 RepID=UPI0014079ED5|nr:hypothetical protein [Amycolatopsis acidicola]